ncbi:MAG: phosphate signaling complex PhoU family protein, partial [Acidimicrobiia bacterium]
VLATLRIADSIERTGDLVTESCEIGKTLYPTPIEQRFRRLLELMSRTAEANTRAAVESYTNSDLAEAAVVFDLDSQLDRLASSLARECAIAEPDTEPGVVAAVALIGHCYERIGDNAVTIGERVQFALTGKHPQRRTRYAGQASSS